MFGSLKLSPCLAGKSRVGALAATVLLAMVLSACGGSESEQPPSESLPPREFEVSSLVISYRFCTAGGTPLRISYCERVALQSLRRLCGVLFDDECVARGQRIFNRLLAEAS